MSLISIILNLALAHASTTCANFVGFYHSAAIPCWYAGLKVEYVTAQDKLIFTYYGGDDGFYERYVADGREHPGNRVTTGAKYTATCSADRLIIERDGQFNGHDQLIFTRTSAGLDFTQNFWNGNTHSCRFVR